MEETRYQENGFQLVVYRQRRADSFMTCEKCQKPMHHVASIFDEWTEDQASLIHYYYCKNCKMISQQTIREGAAGQTKRQTTFEQPPCELVVEILATARQQNGRNVTVMTINRHWWAPHRYPLTIGAALVSEEGSSVSSHRLEDEERPAVIPLPRYTPQQEKLRTPFTSRRRKADEEETTAE